jgi:hypothetical protein
MLEVEMSPAKIADIIIGAISSSRFRYATEKELQQGIFRLTGLPREYRLSEADIIDFFWQGCGVEVKIGGTKADLIRQLTRYASCDAIKCLVVVTARAGLADLPSAILGKPIYSVVVRNL